MDNKTDKEKIRNAFKDLRKQGYFARMNFWCCQSCGCAAVPEKYKDKFVFYHNQDAEALGYDGNIGGKNRRFRRFDSKAVLYLTHGEGGDGREICETLKNQGLDVEWDGDMGKRIMVKHLENV